MRFEKRHFIITIVVFVSVVSLYYIGKSITGRHSSVGDYDEFSQCLTENGAVMYGAEYCGHCNNQKDMFGNSFKYIEYVECSDVVEYCKSKGIEGVPTWEIDGELYTGVQELSELSEYTGCPL